MKNFLKYILLCNLFLMCSQFLFAQKDTVKNMGDENIIVVKDYKPTLSDATKISGMPGPDTSTFADPNFTYSIAPIKTETNYNSTPIKPVKIKDDNIKKLNKGYVRAGYGTHQTLYADAFYNALRSKEFDAGVNFNYLGSSGKIKKFGETANNDAGFDAYGKKFTDLGVLSVGIGLGQKTVHYYGYDRRETIYSKKQTRQSFGNIDGNVKFDNYTNKDSEIKYNAGVSFNGYRGKRDENKTTESSFVFDGNIGKELFENPASLRIILDYTKTSQPLLQDLSNTIFGLYPRYQLDVPSFIVLVGGNIEFETAADETRYHLYPHAEAHYKLATDVLHIYAKVTGGLQKHTYKEITTINPYTNALVVPGNTNNKFEVSGGMNVKLDKEIVFSADASYNRMKDYLYYINNNQIEHEPVTFTNVYDDAEIIKVHGQLQYERNEKFAFALGAEYNNNKPDTLYKAWYVPAVSVNLSGMYSMQEKIIVRADLFYRTTRYAPAYDGSIYAKLKPYLDANLGVEYRYSKQLSAFLNLNNIGAVQYFQWYNYPSYRLQVLGGVTYSF